MMKENEITVNGFFYDGKKGVREVLSIDNGSLQYRILSARNANEFLSKEQKMVPIIGDTSICLLSSFASWAKHRLTEQEKTALLLRIVASKVKLSPGEVAFMNSAIEETNGQISMGTRIEISHTEGRAASGLEKKGLIRRDRKTNEAEFTELGAAWIEHGRSSLAQ